MRAVMTQPGRIGARTPGLALGPDAIGPVITEAGGGDLVAGRLTDLKDAGHHLAPAVQDQGMYPSSIPNSANLRARKSANSFSG